MTDAGHLNFSHETRVKYPTQEASDCWMIRKVDWNRIEVRVARAKQPVRNTAAWAAGFSGVALSAALAWLPWQAAYDALPDDVREDYAYISAVLACVFVFAVVAVAFVVWYGRGAEAERTAKIDDILDDMGDIAAAFDDPKSG